MRKLLLSICFLLVLSACSAAPAIAPTNILTAAATATVAAPLTLTSSAFAMGEAIPEKFTCAGENISPPLAWNKPPAKTQFFALLLDDPDAAGFVHWVLYNIPASSRSLPEMNDSGPKLQNGLMQGANSMGGFAYAGSCPPSGSLHHYSFRLYALDAPLDKPVFDKDTLLAAIDGHVLAQSELIGTYTSK